MLALLCSLAPVACSLASGIDYDPRRPAALKECDDHRYHGREAKTAECYAKLLSSSIDLVVLAESAWATGDLKRANDYFRRASQFDSSAAVARARWGRLFIETHQFDDAASVFRDALAQDKNDVQAQLGVAEVFAAQFAGPARQVVDQLIGTHADLIGARVLSARMALEEGDLETADRELSALRPLIEKSQLPPLEMYAIQASLDLTRDANARSSAIRKALDYNPHYGEIYADLAHVEVMRRKYKEANEQLKRAIDIQPSLWSAHAELGANLLRLNDIANGQRELEAAYSGDPYSATTVNTLRLLEQRDRFDQVPAVAAGSAPPAFNASLQHKEAAAMAPYVLKLGNQALQTLSERYQFKLRQPVMVELYPNHDDFAVRVAGLPGIGLLGVTFGYLVAMDSPAGRSTGDFHWGSTMWHELTHVYTLELTDHRVPRWLSEGLSMFEEWRTGPAPGIAVTPDMLEAMRDDQLLPIADLDSGFIRPKYPNQVQVSYEQAGLICTFIESHWGFDRLLAFLKEFTRETTTARAVEATFKISPTEFDKQFNEYLQQQYGAAAARIQEWKSYNIAAHKAAEAKKWPEALTAARAANEMYPQYSGSGSPYLVAARALDEAKQREDAIRTLLTYRRFGGWDPAALTKLAQWLREAHRDAEATTILEALNYVDPLDSEHHTLLGESLLATNKPQEALTEFKTLLALDTNDPAAAKFGLARALRATGDASGGKRALLEALEIAPHYKPAQALLLETIEEPHP